MDQGKLVAEVLLDCQRDFSLPRLWEYQVRTFTETPPAKCGDGRKTAAERAATDAMRRIMMTLRPAEMDLMFERGLIKLRAGVKKPGDALVLLRGLDHPALLGKLMKIPIRGKAVKDIVGRIPRDYDPAAVSAWVKDYEDCKLC